MPLEDKLAAIRSGAAAKFPAEIRAVIHQATAELEASGQAGRARKVGDAAPDFTLPGPDGKPVALRDLLANGPLVVTFYRGVWCPFCNAELQALEEALPEMRALGASLVAISPETAANSRKSVRQNELSFPILTDHGNAVADAFGLRFRLPDALIATYKGFGNNLEAVNGEDSWTLPMPGRFVIAPDGRIVYAEVNADYSRRPEPAEMLPAIGAAAQLRAAA